MSSQEEKVNEIVYRFGGRLIGSSTMKRLVAETLLKLPEEMVKLVTEKVWFVSSFDDAWGFTIKGEEIKDKYLVFLSDELFKESQDQQRYTIVHEIGHVILNHLNAILEHQSQKEIDKQEEEADEFALKYLGEVG